MSILIKGMEMPKSCYACMFFAQTDYWNKEDEADILSRCKRTGEKTWESVNGYLPDCPIIPVPAHGRLIDADALVSKIQKALDAQGDSWIESPVRMAERAMRVADFRQIKNAPTIIPASFENPTKNARYSQDNPAEEGE